MTDLLFLSDSYSREFSARVVSVHEGVFVELDRTLFYHFGGGQLCDLGRITRGNFEFNVVDVIKKDGLVLHKVDKQGLSSGDSVKGVIDWDRRFKLMRMHTSAHIFSTVVFNSTGALCTGNQLGLDESRMDFSSDIDELLAEKFAAEANFIIGKDLDVSVKFVLRDEALLIPGVVKLKDKSPPPVDPLRLVIIGDFDSEADGGTHVKNTSEIGKIVISRVENKGKLRKRVYWRLE